MESSLHGLGSPVCNHEVSAREKIVTAQASAMPGAAHRTQENARNMYCTPAPVGGVTATTRRLEGFSFPPDY